MQFPTSIIGGDTLSISFSDSSYPSSDWTAHLAIRGTSTFNSVATSNADGSFTFNVAASVTATLIPGPCSYVVYVNDTSGNSYTVQTGTVTITLRPDLLTTSDVRTQAARIVDAIDATIEGRATSDQQAYTINGRSIARIPLVELLALRKYYVELANKEKRKQNGISSITKLTVRPL